MAIPRKLLAATESRALRLSVYGGAGLLKTHSIHTLPPPILHFDVGEGGTGSVLPWIRRRREWDESTWEYYTDEQRQMFFDLVQQSDKDLHKPLPPAPYIDVIHYDNMEWGAYEKFKEDLANIDYTMYNSAALDSLQEFSELTKTFSRGAGNEGALMNDVPFAWVGAQERAGIQLRVIRDLANKGIFTYMTASEDISKEYVKQPMSKGKGEPVEQPFSVRGSVNLPGKLVNAMPHLPDVLMHARSLNGKPTWVTKPEPVAPGSAAWWDAKDRYGRLQDFEAPNFYQMFGRFYGPEGRRAIYEYALTTVTKG
jgi:hypothetical protein